MQLLSAMGARLDESAAALHDSGVFLRQCMTDRVREAGHTAARLRERLAAVSPMAVLNRGYALVYDGEEHLLTRAAEAERENRMTLQFADGRVAVTRKETP